MPGLRGRVCIGGPYIYRWADEDATRPGFVERINPTFTRLVE